MKILPDDLPNDVESLKTLVLEQAVLLSKKETILTEKEKALTEKDSQLVQWQSKYELILEQWRLAQQKQFGKSSEVSPGQGELFDESTTDLGEVVETELDTQTVSYTRRKPKRQRLPKDLPRETVIIDIDESDKVCECCLTKS